MDALVKAVAALAAARTVDELVAVVRTSARSLTGADGVTFVLRDGAHVYYADEDAISPLWKGSRFPLEQCISGRAMLSGKAIHIPDVYEDDRVPIEAYRPTFVRSLMMTPIGHDESIAAIGTYWASVHEATLQERQKVQALAEAAALAFRNIDLAGDSSRRWHGNSVRDWTPKKPSARRMRRSRPCIAPRPGCGSSSMPRRSASRSVSLTGASCSPTIPCSECCPAPASSLSATR